MNGIPRSLNCRSTLAYATRALLINRAALSIFHPTGDGNIPAVCIQFTKQLIIEREALMKVSHRSQPSIPLVPTFRLPYPGRHPGLLSFEGVGGQSRAQEFLQ